jgi:hypothetical protein
VPYDRFDYEFASLVLYTHQYPKSTIQTPIETVYLDGNASSHYRPIRDSITIGAIFFKFFFLSISTTILDYTVFTLIFYQTKHILGALIGARIASIIYNFTCSRSLVFKVKTDMFKQLAKYLTLVAVFMCISWGFIRIFYHFFGGYVVIGKALAEGGLFFLSWLIQRRFIFVPKSEKLPDKDNL